MSRYTDLPSLSTRWLIDETALVVAKILKLPVKQLAKVIQYWVTRVPINERADLIQHLVMKLLQDKPANIKLAFITVKRDTFDYMEKFWTWEKSKLSLDTKIERDDGDMWTSGAAIVDLIQFEEILNLGADLRALLQSMDKRVRIAIADKLAGRKLTNGQKQLLEQFGKTHLDFLQT